MLHITCCFLCVCVCLRLTCPPLSCCWLFAACVPITRHRFCTIIGPIFDHPRVMSLLAFKFPNHFLPFDDVEPVFYRVFCIEFLHFEKNFFSRLPPIPPSFYLSGRRGRRSHSSEITHGRRRMIRQFSDAPFPIETAQKKPAHNFFVIFHFPFHENKKEKRRRRKKRVYKIRLLFHSKQKIK